MDAYPTVADVTESARQLAARHPDRCRLRPIGTSRGGRPILMLSVGRGPHHALVVGGPHPDEPVGGASVRALAEHLVRGDRPSPATDPGRVTWDLVLCLDPDGAAVVDGPSALPAIAPADLTLERYFRGVFRPAATEQPEWAPIVTEPLPESLALFRLIAQSRPFLQVSLHGIDAGGTWVQLTRDLPGLTEPFHASAAHHAIPLQRGSYDALHWENPSAGVYVLPPLDSTGRHAAGTRNIGLSTWCAPLRHGGVTAIVEVPLWTTDLTADPTPHPEAGRALRDLSRLLREDGRRVTALFTKARGLLPPAQDDPRTRVLEWMADDLYDLVASAWEPLAHYPDRLTTAQICALDVVARRQPLRAAGLLLTLLAASPDAAAAPLHDELNRLFTTWCTDFRTALRLRPVPVRRQVAHQVGTVLVAAECALAQVRGA